MISLPFILDSARDGSRQIRGTIIITNVGGDKRRRNYRVRAYAKGAERKGLRHMIEHERPFREAEVLGHRAEQEPVWNLVAKALAALGYS